MALSLIRAEMLVFFFISFFFVFSVFDDVFVFFWFISFKKKYVFISTSAKAVVGVAETLSIISAPLHLMNSLKPSLIPPLDSLLVMAFLPLLHGTMNPVVKLEISATANRVLSRTLMAKSGLFKRNIVTMLALVEFKTFTYI